MKKLGKATIATLMLTGLTMGYGAATPIASASQPVTLNFWYLWTGPEGKALQQVVDNFNHSQSQIFVKGLSIPDQQKQIAAMSAGNGAFDISDAFNNNVASWADKGVIAPLDDFIKQSNYKTNDFIPSALQTCLYQGHTYALPIAMHDNQLLYNKDLFAAAGIKSPPRTTGELLTDMKKLTVVKNGQIVRLGLDAYDYTNMAFDFGGTWVDANGHPSPTNPGVLKAYHFFIDNVVKKYGAAQIQKFESGFGQYASPQNPFYVGKVAMAMDGEWQAQFIREYAPKLHWGAVPLPYPTGQPKLARTSLVADSVFFIPTNSRHKQEAWKFLSYLESPHAMETFTAALANLPTRKSLINSPTYKKLGIAPWLQELTSKNLHIMPNEPWMDQYQNDLQTQDGFISLLKETPEQGMKKVANSAQKYAH